MSTKLYICILAAVGLLVSCENERRIGAPATTISPATSASHHTHGPTFSPSPIPIPGKRTETGTVIGLTATQITLRCADVTWIIKRTVNTVITAGTLKIGSTVTVAFNWPDDASIL